MSQTPEASRGTHESPESKEVTALIADLEKSEIASDIRVLAIGYLFKQASDARNHVELPVGRDAMSLEHLLNTVAASLDRRLDSREMLGAVLDRLYSEGLSITRNGDAQRNHLVASIEKLKAWMASLAVDERPRDEKGFASLESRGEWSRVLTRLHRLETQIGAMQDCRLKTLLIKLHVPSITLGDDKIAGPFLQVRSDGGVKMLEEILGECYFLEKHRYDPLRSTGSVSAEVAAQKDPVLVGYDRITRPSAKFIIDTITKAVRALNAAHDTTRQETVERMIDES